MKSRIFATALAIVGLAIIDAQVASATDKVWNGTSADFNDSGNWAPTGVPAGGDVLRVPQTGNDPVLDADITVGSLTIGPDVTLTTGAFDLTISGPGGLIIESGGVLDVDAAGGFLILTGGGVHTIHGTVNLADFSATTFRITTADVVLNGGGKIVGRSTANAAIELNAVTLVSRVIIEGKLTIGLAGAAGTFINEGMVHANVAGTLDLTDNTYRDGHTGVYAVSSNASAILNFAANIVDATEIASDFFVAAGRLDIRDPMITIGNLDYFEGATVEAFSVDARWGHAFLRD